MKRRAILFTMCLFLLIGLAVQSAAAMTSTTYRLDWFVPLTGGGGHASSSNYAADFTVGQTAIGSSASTNYSAGLGFWTAVWEWIVNLPLLFK